MIVLNTVCVIIAIISKNYFALPFSLLALICFIPLLILEHLEIEKQIINNCKNKEMNKE